MYINLEYFRLKNGNKINTHQHSRGQRISHMISSIFLIFQPNNGKKDEWMDVKLELREEIRNSDIWKWTLNRQNKSRYLWLFVWWVNWTKKFVSKNEFIIDSVDKYPVIHSFILAFIHSFEISNTQQSQ